MYCQKLGQTSDLVINVSRSKTAGRGKWKAGFDLKTLIFISDYSYFYGDIEGITYFPSSHDRSISMVGALPFSPLTMTLAPL